MTFNSQFDYVVSFWCLQWACANIQKAFLNIINALKTGGKFLTLFPAGDDPFIMSYYTLRKSGQFASLHNFIPPVDYSHLNNLEKNWSHSPAVILM